MKDGKFRFRTQEEMDAMTLEEKTRYFQELMRELKKREDELEQINPEPARSRARNSAKPTDSQGGS